MLSLHTYNSIVHFIEMCPTYVKRIVYKVFARRKSLHLHRLRLLHLLLCTAPIRTPDAKPQWILPPGRIHVSLDVNGAWPLQNFIGSRVIIASERIEI